MGCDAELSPALVAGASSVTGVGASGVEAAGASAAAGRGNPERRYSTALSGLLNAARKALSTCSLSKPIAIMFCTAVSLTFPCAKVDAVNSATVSALLAFDGDEDSATVVVAGAASVLATLSVVAGLAVGSAAAATGASATFFALEIIKMI